MPSPLGGNFQAHQLTHAHEQHAQVKRSAERKTAEYSGGTSALKRSLE